MRQQPSVRIWGWNFDVTLRCCIRRMIDEAGKR